LVRALLPTRVSPNGVTLASIACGLGAGVLLFFSFAVHQKLAALCLFLSAVFDCADGQLARLRGLSSAFGRMLDGVGDAIVATSAVSGAAWSVWNKYHDPWWFGLFTVLLVGVSAVTGAFHVAMYDHYKNVYLCLTESSRKVEDLETQPKPASILAKLVWNVYRFYSKCQMKYLAGFDPFTPGQMGQLPSPHPRYGDVYRRHAGDLMRKWRTWFGFGTMIFGLAASIALDVIEYYALARVILLNVAFYGYMRPAQRRASRAAFREMGLVKAP
jgi:phosphatidylglycerophosphate synthase